MSAEEGLHVLPQFGLPYARAGTDERGYYAECPACGIRCYGDGETEDEVTKGSAAGYAEHFVHAADEEASR